MNSHSWISKTHTLDHLKDRAAEFDWGIELSGDYSHSSMLDFLKFAEVIPPDMNWTRKNALPRTSLNRDAIPAGYLAEVAYEWDLDGFSAATEFVDSLSFEVSGTEKNAAVSEVMSELGRDR